MVGDGVGLGDVDCHTHVACRIGFWRAKKAFFLQRRRQQMKVNAKSVWLSKEREKTESAKNENWYLKALLIWSGM